MIEEIAEVTVQVSTERKNKHKKHNKTEKTSKKRITLKIQMEKGTGKVVDLTRGPSRWPNTR